MSSTISGPVSTAVTLGSGGYNSPLTVTSTGTIAPPNAAVALFMPISGSVTNAGHIIGSAGAVLAYTPNPINARAGSTGVQIAAGTLANSGSIAGGAGGLVNSYYGGGLNGGGGTGITQSSGMVVNSGVISGGAGGAGNLYSVHYFGGLPGGHDSTSGGDGGAGAIITGGTFVNNGTVNGGSGGAALVSPYGGGATAGAGGVGVSITTGLFIDNGAISGSSAVVFSGSGTAVLLVESGASFSGNVYANGDANATLALGGTTAFLLSGISNGAGMFNQFQHISFTSTLAGFGISGDAAGLAAGQTISGFGSRDTIILTGFAATSESLFSVGELVLKNGAGATETLDLTGYTSTSDIALSSDGTGTTLVSALPQINGPVNANITLYTGAYGKAVGISSTGAVTALAGAAGANAYAGAYYGTVVPPTNGGAGGTAITGGAGTSLNNQGGVTGGTGGGGGHSNFSATAGATGGVGGVGVSLASASITNSGNIAGGTGGTGGYGPVEYSFTRFGAVGGGGGAGGTGLVLTGGTGINLAQLTGGTGGSGGNGGFSEGRYGNFFYYGGGGGGTGGTGLSMSGGAAFTNSGTILGGAGGLGGLNGHLSGLNRGRAGSGGTGNGVYLNGGTLTNAGLISGAAAVSFGATSSTLVVASGGSFAGAVAARSGAGDVLAFANGASLDLGASFTNFAVTDIVSAATVTLRGDLFSSVVNNGTIDVADGTSLTFASALTGTGLIIDDPAAIVLDGAVSTGQTFSLDGTGNTLELGDAADFHGTITGFSSGDILLIDHFTASSNAYANGTLVLNGTNGATPESLTIALAGSFTAADFTFSAAGAGTDIVTCFYPGTRIATPDGEIAVESLVAGDLIRTADGKTLPVRWLGRSDVSTRFADKLRVLPIRITAGALGQGLPRRDLLLSPDHAVFLGNILVQAAALLNGTSIRREHGVPECFSYYHVELATHELLLAEEMAVESFVDNVDRMSFANWEERTAPDEPIMEMPYPRAKSCRQLPLSLRECYAA